MTDRELVSMLCARGIDAVSDLFRNAGVNAALDRGLDVTHWQVRCAPGAVLFVQVAHADDGARRRGLGSAKIYDGPPATITRGGRVLALNATPSPAWDAVIAGAHEPGVPLTVVYADGTVQDVAA